MTTVLNHASAPPPRTGPYKVDISRGRRIGRVSSEWFSRPDDERYLSLRELHAATLARAQRAMTRTIETREVRVEASRDDAERLALIVPGHDEPVAPTHWSFGQLASLVGAPSGYLRQLPAPLAGINLQHGLLTHRGELMKTLETEDGRTELRAVTGPDYGRIWDHELVEAVMRIAGNGTGDTRWKVPGLLDWLPPSHPDRVRAEHCLRSQLLLPQLLQLRRRGADLMETLDPGAAIPGYFAPVHRALTEQILLGGAPRSVAIVNGTLAGTVGLGLRLCLVGLLIWAVGHAAAVWAARRDPQFLEVGRRHMRYPTFLRA